MGAGVKSELSASNYQYIIFGPSPKGSKGSRDGAARQPSRFVRTLCRDWLVRACTLTHGCVDLVLYTRQGTCGGY